jgi:hypothetical protein
VRNRLNDEQEIKQSLDVDFMNLLYEDDTVSIVEIYVLHEGINRNKTDISHEVVLDALATLANKPIYCILNEPLFRDDSTDFVEHARKDSDKKNILIFGTFPESAIKAAEFVVIDDKTYLKVQAVLWKLYCPIPLSILKNRNGEAKISIEHLVKGTQDKDGILHISKMIFLSAVALGTQIKEGIEGSKLDIIRYSLDETIKKSEEYYNQYNKLKIPDSVKSNINKALEIKNSLSYSEISDDVAMANFIISNNYISLDEFNNLSKYFNNHTYKDNDISWLLKGGDEAKNWIKEMNSKINIDNQILENKECEIIKNSSEEEKDGEKMDIEKNAEVVEDKEEVKTESIVVEALDETAVEKNAEDQTKDDKTDANDADKQDDDKNDPAEDKEDYKSKYESLLTEYDSLKVELNSYKAKEAKESDEIKMNELLNTYSHCYSEDELKIARNSITNSIYSDFEKAVNSQINSFVLNIKNSSKSDEENKDETVTKINYSVSPFKVESYDFSATESKGTLEDIVTKSKVKLKVK